MNKKGVLLVFTHCHIPAIIDAERLVMPRDLWVKCHQIPLQKNLSLCQINGLSPWKLVKSQEIRSISFHSQQIGWEMLGSLESSLQLRSHKSPASRCYVWWILMNNDVWMLWNRCKASSACAFHIHLISFSRCGCDCILLKELHTEYAFKLNTCAKILSHWAASLQQSNEPPQVVNFTKGAKCNHH